jgi:hypothetical protein
MARHSLMVPGVLVALGVGIVVSMYMLLGGGPAPAEERQGGTSPVLAARGARPGGEGPARRVDLDPRAGDETPARLPDVRPEASNQGEPREVVQPSSPPAPPLVLTDEQKAAEAAYLKLRDEVARDVGKQLAGQQSSLRKACWKDTGAAKSAEFTVNASFDAEGKLLGMGISDVRGPDGAATAGVGQCLRQQGIALSAEKPGQGVTVDVPLHLP